MGGVRGVLETEKPLEISAKTAKLPEISANTTKPQVKIGKNRKINIFEEQTELL